MLLFTICILVGVALWLLESIVSPGTQPSGERLGAMPHWQSDYKQLRVEYHQSIDRSLTPPRH